MTIDITKFLLSLASEMANSASVALGADLWVYEANERTAAKCYAVLRPYGGNPASDQRVIPQSAVQVMVSAKSAVAGMTLGRKLYEALQDEEGLPRHGWKINGKRFGTDGITIEADDQVRWIVHLVNLLQPPGIVGRSEQIHQVAFNFDVTFDLVQD